MNGKRVVPFKYESEDDLVAAALEGDRTAIESLIVDHLPIQAMIRALSRRLRHPQVEAGDLHNAGRLGTLEALHRFDPTRGVQFRTYAFHFIRGEMIKSLYTAAQQRERSAGREPVKLVPFTTDLPVEEAVEETAEAELFARDGEYGLDAGYGRIEAASASESVRNFVGALPSSQRQLVEDVFWRGQSHAEAARTRGVSRPAVSRTLQRVLARGRRDLADPYQSIAA